MTKPDTGLCLWPSAFDDFSKILYTRPWLSPPGFRRVLVTRQVSLIVSDERLVQSPFLMSLLLFQEAVPVIACLEVLTPSRFVFQGIVVRLHSSRILCSLRGAVTKGFINTVSRSLWSDSTWTFFPCVHWLNRSRLNKTAKSFFFMWAYLDLASVKDLVVQATGQPSFSNSLPTPFGEASQLTVIGFCTSQNLTIGPSFSVRMLFIPWKALSCSFDH